MNKCEHVSTHIYTYVLKFARKIRQKLRSRNPGMNGIHTCKEN